MKWSIIVLAMSRAVISPAHAGLSDITAGKKLEQTPSLQSIQEMVAQNERLYSLIKMDITGKVIKSIPESKLAEINRIDPSRKLVKTGSTYYTSTWAQDDNKQYLTINSYNNSNKWTMGYLNVTDGQVMQMGELPDLMAGNITYFTDFHWVMFEVRFLGLRPFNGHHKLSDLLVKEHASFDGDIDIIDGRQAYVVCIKKPGKTSFTRMWIDCERGMPIRWEHYDQHPDSRGARLTSEVKSIELHHLPNGGWFPVNGTRSIYHGPPKPYMTSRQITVDVSSITIKREDIPDSLFEINFPFGAKVYNAIIGAHIKVVRKLLGKSLPKFEEMEITFTEEKIKGKKLVICFWDMEQRPSRNCLRQLSVKAQELKTKGVLVGAVQASKVDEEKLNDWIKKNNIPFSIGMIQGDQEEIHFSWGVRSLPWLILTDKERVVTAEGFTLAELDEKLNGNSH